MSCDSKENKMASTCIVSFTIGDSGIRPLENLTHIFSEIPNEVYLITTKRPCEYFRSHRSITTYGIEHITSDNPLNRIMNFCASQLKIVSKMVKIRKRVDKWLFFVGGDTQILPMFLAKISGRPIYLLYAGSTTLTLSSSKDGFYKFTSKISIINRKICNNIIVYTPNLVSEYGLQNCVGKIKFGYEHIINFEAYKPMKGFHDRENIIGYLGRLSAEKGVINFVDSMPLFLAELEDTKVNIIGDGALRQEVESTLLQGGFSNRVKIMGWIPHDDLPRYLSELKLLVVPSSTEGLPNVIIESMACGVPVLATSVGSIPDIIIDGVNGFLMHDNSPMTIAQNIKRALMSPNLSEIAQNGNKLVQEKFRASEIIDCWRRIIV